MTTKQHVVYLSKKGIKELKRSIAKLEHRKNQMIAGLRELDKIDTHEQRLSRVEKLAQLEITESELADKQLILNTAKVYPRKRDALKVALGSVVDLIDTQGRMVRYQLVNSIEADPSDGRISVKSPLGQNLIGKTIRETVEWGNGLRVQRLQLINIV